MNRHLSQAAYERLLGILLVASIVGITLSVSDVVGRAFDVPARLGTRVILLNVVMVLGWGLVAWLAHQGRKLHRAPPSWAILVVVALGWAAVLINHFG
jgi:hypothetical protein